MWRYQAIEIVVEYMHDVMYRVKGRGVAAQRGGICTTGRESVHVTTHQAAVSVMSALVVM
jgi:hypothetical protein